MNCNFAAKVLATAAAGLGLLAAPAMVVADETTGVLSLHGGYKADVIAYDAGEGRRGTAELDLLSIVAEANLDRVAPGLMAHIQVQNTSGGEPNAAIGSVRGFDNSEVDRQRLRLYEAWVQKTWGDDAVSLLAGFYDFNSEFNATDSSAIFLGPGYGISTEVSGTGPAGPSVFPSTGLGVRGRFKLGEDGYAQAAVINAQVGVLGDPGGAQFDLTDGVLVVAETGWRTDAAGVSVGAWGYTSPSVDTMTPNAGEHAQGLYVLAERRLGGEDSPARAFLRAGVSDGKTGEFAAGLQAGISVSPAFASRPDSAFGVGVDYAEFSDPYRGDLRSQGVAASRGETGLEITYADRLTKRLMIQPDLQFIFDPGGDRNRKIASIATIRFSVDF